MIFGRNPNKDYKQAIQFTGGSIHGYSPSHNPNLTAYKTSNGTRGVEFQGSTWYDDGNGRFVKSTGRDYLTYDVPKKEEPAPAPSPSGGGGGGGSSRPSGGTASYGTTAPYAGGTGNAGLDASTQALMDMVASLTETLATQRTIGAEEIAEVSRPPGEGLGSTVLSQTYVPSKEKKKKSYLTPISVG